MWWLFVACAPKPEAAVEDASDVADVACQSPVRVGDVAVDGADLAGRVPPIDLRKPEHTEIATFALG